MLEIPAVNAYIDMEKKEIVYREYCDISVAVASPAKESGEVCGKEKNGRALEIGKEKFLCRGKTPKYTRACVGDVALETGVTIEKSVVE